MVNRHRPKRMLKAVAAYHIRLANSTFLFFSAWAYPRADLKWLRTSVDVLSEAKSLNEVKGQKVAGSSPVEA